MITQKWNVHSYEIFLSGEDQGNSPFSMTSYDHTKGDRIEKVVSKRKPSEGVKRRLTKEEKPRWKHMYAGFVRAGMQLPQAKRKASGIIRGITTQEARGHKEEIGIFDEIEKVIPAPEYNSEALFSMQKYFEQLVEHHLKWYFEPAQETDIYADFDTQHQGQYRRFEWKLFGESGELRYFITYEKGQIINMQMWGRKTKEQEFDWDSFDVQDFLLNIKELRVWE